MFMNTLRLVFLIMWSLLSSISFSQNIIKGTIYDADNGDITLEAHIVLWHNDSIIAQCVNSKYGFRLENIPNGNYILNISHIGYQVKQMMVNIKEHLDLGNIPLTFGYKMDEVVVKSARNVTSYKNSLLHVKVKQTFLQELPDMESLLSNIPGVFLKNGKFTYFGKGQILFLINGREVKSAEEINMLNPSLISEIVVDNMPGSKYDSHYSSVVNIKTTSEKSALMIYNTNTWGRHYSNAEGFTSQSKIKNTLIDFGYSFRKRRNTLYSVQTEENFQTDNVFKQFFTDTTFSNRVSHDWHIGTQSKLKTGILNWKYSGYSSSNKPVYNSDMQHVSASIQEDYDIFRTGKYREKQHLTTLDYQVEMAKKNILRITTDYLYQCRKNNSHATETSEGFEKLTNQAARSTYRIYSLLAEYEHPFGDLIKLSIGTRYSHVYNKNNSKENEVASLYNLHENRYALYIEGRFQWQKLTMKLGLRGEMFDKEYHRTAQIGTSYKENFFLPSFSFTYNATKDLQISLSGNNKVFLPSFNELTPITTYLNQYSYMTGNPLLKPTVRYDFGIGAVWMNKFNAKLEYYLVKNDRTAYTVQDEDNMQVLKYTYTNIGKTREFMGMLTYSDQLFKRHTFNLSVGIIVPNAKIPYMEQYLNQSTPAYFTQLSCNWKIGKMTNISASYLFQSISYDKVETYSATHNLKCNVSVIPIKNKLSLNLQINDILKKAIGNWETNYGYIRTRQYNNTDSRNILFSLRYTLNSIKSTKQSISNIEEINRL